MRVYHNFFLYPDPDQRFLMRIQPNDTDPTDQNTALHYIIIYMYIVMVHKYAPLFNPKLTLPSHNIIVYTVVYYAYFTCHVLVSVTNCFKLRTEAYTSTLGLLTH